ncbi:MAG TPA: hypothetical protein VN285_09090 [Candidatus Deferrimicrobium sp.]|nr:hypothetical protein [Candidatus Deferrimicrobium sp.]
MKAMRTLIAVVIVGAALSRPVGAEQVPLNNLRTPSSPGFVILGVEPSSVERPLTPRDFAVSLASAAGDPNLLPDEYAIEAAPYWLVPHDSLTYDDFYANDPLKNIYRNLSMSIAVSKDQSFGDSVAADTRLGIGIRSLLLRGQDDPRFRISLDSLQNAMLDAESTEVEDSLNAATKKLINEKDNQPFGFSLELAGAMALLYPESDTHKGKAYRGGVWITPAYRPVTEGQIEFLSVLRLLLEDGVRPRYDLGFRLLWFANDRLSMSAEYVSRLGDIPDSDNKDTYRIAGVVDYRFSYDLHMTATFGRDFEGEAGTGELLARLGIDFSFGDVPFYHVE